MRPPDRPRLAEEELLTARQRRDSAAARSGRGQRLNPPFPPGLPHVQWSLSGSSEVLQFGGGGGGGGQPPALPPPLSYCRGCAVRRSPPGGAWRSWRPGQPQRNLGRVCRARRLRKEPNAWLRGFRLDSGGAPDLDGQLLLGSLWVPKPVLIEGGTFPAPPPLKESGFLWCFCQRVAWGWEWVAWKPMPGQSTH